MPAATVTSKGQVTIPVEVRRELGLTSGTRVDFVRIGDGVYQLVAVTETVRSIKGTVAAPGGRAVTVEQMNDAIAAGAASRR